MSYKTLETYRAGELSHLWARELFILRDADPKLSPIRAGELAAAKIAGQAGKEYAQLEEVLKFNADEGTPQANLYDWLSEHEDIKRVLTDMSGTRTLLADMEAYQAPRFNVGDTVRIKAGLYAGLVVTVTRVDRLESGSWIVEHDLHKSPYYEEALELVSRGLPPISPSQPDMSIRNGERCTHADGCPYTPIHRCSECSTPLCFIGEVIYDNRVYCAAHMPAYDKHQQW